MMGLLLVLVLACSTVAVFGEDCPLGTCPSDETCCPTPIPGEYSCCPYKDATCCADQTRCCPQDTECDLVTGTCSPSDQGELLIHNRLEKRQGESEDSFSDQCEPGTCLEDQTCCPTGIPGDYSCCAYSNAVCCVGHTFCCPEDSECDIIKGRCIPHENVDNKLEKRQGLVEDESTRLPCDDGSACSLTSTCCPIADGNYGCCPHTHATCCPDMIHCCPHDQKCDVTSRYCVGTRTVQQSLVREHALPIDSEDLA